MQAHWETIHRSKAPSQVSWYQDHPARSLDFIQRTGIGKASQVIDIGGGISTLVDHLLQADYRHVTVLDISAAALQVARQRLGQLADRVSWIEADITQADLPAQAYDLWHDRAVFHFLTGPEDRRRYVQAVGRSVKPGGHVIIATFALDGPAQCSGLDVMRYSPEGLQAEFGAAFRLVDSLPDVHVTPFGTEQRFVYVYFRLGEWAG